VYEGTPPNGDTDTMWKLVLASFTVFFIGLLVFRRMKPMFYEHI
jgi:ABC-type polysaccharide/polyol phosphate export permease